MWVPRPNSIKRAQIYRLFNEFLSFRLMRLDPLQLISSMPCVSKSFLFLSWRETGY